MKRLIISFLFWLLSSCVMASVGDLESIAEKKYQALWASIDQISRDANAFWQLAIGLETLVDYHVVKGTDPAVVLEKALTIFNNKISLRQNWWWDDFGWWGIFFDKALRLLPESAKSIEYQKASELCFAHMNNEAPYAWDKASKAIQAQQVPRFKGGCYNGDLVNIKDQTGLLGCQNTVTNALFLELSLRLFIKSYYAYLKRPNDALNLEILQYWNAIERQQIWFSEWYKEGLFNASIGLVEERVANYKDGVAAIYYSANRAWVADQGVIVGGIIDLLSITKVICTSGNPLKLDLSFVNRAQLKSMIRTIICGVKSGFVNDNNILTNIHKDSGDNFPFGDVDDYSTGTGIFLRYLKYSSHVDFNFQKIIHATAADSAKVSLPVIDLSSFVNEQNSLANINASLAFFAKCKVFNFDGWNARFAEIYTCFCCC